MRERVEVRESGFAERPDSGTARSDDIEQPHRVDLAIAVKLAPDQPGAYRFWDSNDHVLYVGKALNLRNRIRGHLSGSDDSVRHRLMISRSVTLDWIVTPNEVEALLLEDMLIKRHHPDFNVRFRDDKRYPILRLDVADEFPTLSVVRRFINDGALYFGPYTSSRTMRSILRVIERYFPLRRCSGKVVKGSRECLNYQIHKCPGVCQNHIEVGVYRETVNQIHLLLSGRNDELIARLQIEMSEFAENFNYEAAAVRRDQLEAVRNVSGGRKLLLPRPVDLDVFAFDSTESKAYGEILFVRAGMISGNVHLHLRMAHQLPMDKIAEHLMIHYYRESPPLPHAVITSCLPMSKEIIEKYLKDLCGRSVKIYSRPLGIRAKLIELARSNLRLHIQTDRRIDSSSDGSEALQQLLNTQSIPRRIEAIDISESQGKHVVGSIVSFFNGKPEKSRYRRYRIQSETARADLDRIQEVLRRRLKRTASSGWDLPDVFLIDGGRLQLKAALSVTKDLYPDQIVISLAKIRNNRLVEGLFLMDGQELVLQPDNSVTKYLDRIRNEAHRFAISYHRLLRDKSMLKSQLSAIPGVGPKRRKVLLEAFGSLEGLKDADQHAIAELPGFGPSLASIIKESVTKLLSTTPGERIKKKP